MKTKLILLGLLATLAANAQDKPWTNGIPPDYLTNTSWTWPSPSPYTLEMPRRRTITRTFVEGSNTFVIEYDYDLNHCYIPATIPPGKPHYTARIKVTLNGKLFGNPFTGEVVPDGGCFEDMPADMVNKARHAPKPESVAVYSLTNNFSGSLTNITPFIYTNRIIELTVTNITGVTNLAQLCGRIGHVWKETGLIRSCILCERKQKHEGEWK